MTATTAPSRFRTGKILRVDLSTGIIREEELSEELRNNYVGGAGVNARLLYEALKDKGMSKERAARIADSPGAASRGGKKSGSGGNASQGGSTAQTKKGPAKGGKAAATRS